jgi:hypothetical protein
MCIRAWAVGAYMQSLGENTLTFKEHVYAAKHAEWFCKQQLGLQQSAKNWVILERGKIYARLATTH